ncbi:MAG: hypothetical protein M3273_03945 [Actinomycetota bacterium]|nr:hypothetical protein [Actinomycetota bacterium]
MTESKEVAVLIHELGGMLSSVQGFAHIAATAPDHPDRERFIGLVASEARRASRAVKDIHLIRSLDGGRISASPPAVGLRDLLDEVQRLAPSLELDVSPDVADVRVGVDAGKLADPLVRCLEPAAPGAPAPRIEAGPDGVRLVRAIAPAEDVTRRTEALQEAYPAMLAFAIAARLLEHWGGALTLSVEGDWTVVTMSFPEPRRS